MTKILSELSAEEFIALENELKADKGEDRIITLDEARDLVKTKNLRVQRFRFPKMPEFDKIIQGIETGEVIAVGGPTKNGKTTLAQTLTAHLSEQGIISLWFTFEVPLNQFVQNLDNVTYVAVPKTLMQGNLEWLKRRIWAAKLRYNARVIFIDNLHHIIDFEHLRNTSLEIGSCIRFLKRLALELNVCIFILCHSRKPELSNDGTPKEVSEWDLRDSSFIPQETDSTIMIQRKFDKKTHEYLSKTLIKVCLHRRTGAMGKYSFAVKEGNFLKEITDYEFSGEIQNA